MLAIERRLFKEVGLFDADRMHLMEDWELAIRLSTCTKFAVSTKVLHISYDSYDNISNTSKGKQAEAILNIISKHLDLYSQWPTEQSMQYLRISAYYFSAAEYTLGLRYLRQALQCGNSSPLPAVSAMAKLIHRNLVNLLPDTGQKVEYSNEIIQRPT
jgi:GT2 family glycosyltransferase